MPAADWPIDCIFCAWLSWRVSLAFSSSWRFLSVMSRMLPTNRRLPPPPHLVHRELDGEGRAVFAHRRQFAPRLAQDPRLAGLEIAPQMAVVLGAVRLGHENLDVLADELRCRPAEYPFGRGIDGVDGPGFVDRENGVQNALEGRVELPLLLVQGRLGILLLRDVEEDPVDVGGLAFFVEDRMRPLEDPADAAVGVPDAVFGFPDARPAQLLQHFGEILAVLGKNEAVERAHGVADEVGGRIAGDLLDVIADEFHGPARSEAATVDHAGHVGDHAPEAEVRIAKLCEGHCQTRFRLLLPREVAVNRGDRDDLSAFVQNGVADRERNLLSLRRLGAHFLGEAAVLSHDPAVLLERLIGGARRIEIMGRLADHLGGFQAELPFVGVVDEKVAPFEVLQIDENRGVFEDRLVVLVGDVGAIRGGFAGTLAVDLEQDAGDAAGLAVRAVQRPRAMLDPPHAAVGMTNAVPQAERTARRQGGVDRRTERRGVVRVNEVSEHGAFLAQVVRRRAPRELDDRPGQVFERPAVRCGAIGGTGQVVAKVQGIRRCTNRGVGGGIHAGSISESYGHYLSLIDYYYRYSSSYVASKLSIVRK